jgi:hypothetical protein
MHAARSRLNTATWSAGGGVQLLPGSPPVPSRPAPAGVKEEYDGEVGDDVGALME